MKNYPLLTEDDLHVGLKLICISRSDGMNVPDKIHTVTKISEEGYISMPIMMYTVTNTCGQSMEFSLHMLNGDRAYGSTDFVCRLMKYDNLTHKEKFHLRMTGKLP